MRAYDKPKILPRYKNTTVCQECGGEYSKNAKWVSVMDTSSGTETPRYSKVADIPQGKCPCCGTPEAKR